MKRVLIITYYWPPSGGSGVQRWLKMSKYLPEYGWQPVIYTTENAEYPIIDPSLEKDVPPEAEVIRRHIFEPYSFYKRFLGIKKDETVKAGFIREEAKKKGWKEGLALWIRGNLFIPDARRWWIKPSVRYLKSYLKEHPVDAIISTGPPHSMHLIAMKLKEAFGLPWIADFRDPWTEIDYYKDLKLGKRADRKQHQKEHAVLTNANQVVVVSHDMKNSFDHLDARKTKVIMNGYDWTPSEMQQNISLSERFTLSHVGVLGSNRNSPIFWETVKELANENLDFKNSLDLQLIGQVDHSIIETIEANGLKDKVSIIPYIPHAEVIRKQQSSQVLLLFINNTPNAKGILTGKLFEYLATARPILCIGPEDGDAARIISENKAGYTVGFQQKEEMKETIKMLFDLYQKGELTGNKNLSISNFSRESLTKQYVAALNEEIHG